MTRMAKQPEAEGEKSRRRRRKRRARHRSGSLSSSTSESDERVGNRVKGSNTHPTAEVTKIQEMNSALKPLESGKYMTGWDRPRSLV